MKKTVNEQDGYVLTEDDAGLYLKEKMEERRKSGNHYPIFTYPSNGLPELNIKGPDRPE